MLAHPALENYLPILVFMGIMVGLSMVVLILAYIRGPFRPNDEKNSPYECGFNAFSGARAKFDIRFYLVAILFIIFDLEIAFLFPWAITFKTLGWFGFSSMMLFLTVLTIGFVYEWKKGALEWQ
jgi:NADH-quinone oxidoreductase subunit A